MDIVKTLRQEKREIKQQLRKNPDENIEVLFKYHMIKAVFFWKERKKVRRNEINECLTVKNENSERIYDHSEILDTTADYYESLYAKKDVRQHEHHEIVIEELADYETDMTHEEEWFNKEPTIYEIKEAIENKKNNKDTDLKNELLKKSKEQFSKVLTPLIKEVWLREKVPSSWNRGSIQSLWKGKGDKE